MICSQASAETDPPALESDLASSRSCPKCDAGGIGIACQDFSPLTISVTCRVFSRSVLP